MTIKNACAVQFDGNSKRYHYGVPNGMEVKVGDLAVVDTKTSSYNNCHGFSIVKIVEVDVEVTNANKYLIQIIDLEAYEQEKQRRERAKVVRSKLEARAKELQELTKYDVLKTDPQGAALLDELKKLES